MMVAGGILFFAGFVITVQESQITQKIFTASYSRIVQYKAEANSKLKRLKAKSNRTVEVKSGWILYSFDKSQFLQFMQFLFDKVIIFTLMICEE